MIDYYETKSQPITKVMVWQAYKEVKAEAAAVMTIRGHNILLNLPPMVYKIIGGFK
jgi:RNA-directed DNA polymerase